MITNAHGKIDAAYIQTMHGDSKSLNAEVMVPILLAVKLEELKPETVKRMMEEVIRRHLGWLIVWGNVFGGVIGLIAKAAGY